MKKLIVFDNKGETFDRFTILDKSTGEMIGASERPFAPNGFGQHCGNVAWSYFANTIGAPYMHSMEKNDPKHYKKIMRLKTAEIAKDWKDHKTIGEVINFNSLPEDVKQFAKQSFN